MQSNLKMLVARAHSDLHTATCAAPITNAQDWHRLCGSVTRMHFVLATILEEDGESGSTAVLSALIRIKTADELLDQTRDQFDEVNPTTEEPWMMHVFNAIEKIQRQQIVKNGNSDVVFKYAQRALSRLTGAMAARPTEYLAVRDFFFGQLYAALIPHESVRTNDLFKDLGFQRLVRGILMSYLLMSLTV